MNALIATFFAAVAMANAGVITAPLGSILQGPGSVSMVVGSEGSVISSVAPEGHVLTDAASDGLGRYVFGEASFLQGCKTIWVFPEESIFSSQSPGGDLITVSASNSDAQPSSKDTSVPALPTVPSPVIVSSGIIVAHPLLLCTRY